MNITIPIPQQANLLVTVGDTLEYGKAIYTLHASEHHVLNISQELQIKPDVIFSYLTQLIGAPIKKGQIIAEKKGLVRKKKITSPVDGTIHSIDHTTGTVTIESMIDTTLPMSAYCTGTIESIDEKNHTLTIAIDNGEELQTKEIKGTAGGILYKPANASSYQEDQDTIDNSLIIIEHLDDLNMSKCEALDANGFLFVSTDTKPSIPYCQLEPEAFQKLLASSSCKYGIFSECDKKCIVY